MAQPRIYLVRHGSSHYKQGHVDIDKAHDLRPQGINEIKKTAEKLGRLLKNIDSKGLEIISSPYGRTLYSSKIIHTHLLETKKALTKVKISTSLQDHKNYDYFVVNPLVKGGNVEFDGETFWVDKAKTNPLNIPDVNFGPREISHIPKEVFKTFPTSYLNCLKSIEKHHSIKKRSTNYLLSLFKKQTVTKKSYILVTHNSVINHILDDFFTDKDYFVKTGELLILKVKGNKLKLGYEIDGKYQFITRELFTAVS